MKANKPLAKIFAVLKEDDNADLLLIEEIFKRVNDGSKVELYAPLEKKSTKTKTLDLLAKIEREILLKARKRGLI